MKERAGRAKEAFYDSADLIAVIAPLDPANPVRPVCVYRPVRSSRAMTAKVCRSERKPVYAILLGHRTWDRGRMSVVMASLARAASMVARSAARLFSAAMRLIMSTTFPIRRAGSAWLRREEHPPQVLRARQSSGRSRQAGRADLRVSKRPIPAPGREHRTRPPDPTSAPPAQGGTCRRHLHARRRAQCAQ